MDTKSLRSSATDGHEKTAKETFLVIRSFAKYAARQFSLTMDEVIEFMTIYINLKSNKKQGLRAGSFNNYCRTGKVSEFTCDILFKFFEEEIPYSIFVGEKPISFDNALEICGILMDKINQSHIAKKTLGKRNDNGSTLIFSRDDFKNILRNTLPTHNFNKLDLALMDLDDISSIDNSIKDDEYEFFNEKILHYGLDPHIYDNNQFIINISVETLCKFDLEELKECYESYKNVTEILASIIRIKEIKSSNI